MQNSNLAHLIIDLDAFIFNAKSEAWKHQVAFPRVYVTFDPPTKLVTVQLWGACRRPGKSNESLWLGLDLREHKGALQGKIIASVTKWDHIYGNLKFSTADSDPIPALLPFSKGTLSVQTPDKLFLGMPR